MPNAAKLLRSGANVLFLLVCVILVLQTAASHMVGIDEQAIPIPGLRQVPMVLGGWKANGEGSLGPDVTAYLKPDDYILRDYVDPSRGEAMNLFVAYFKSLQNSYGPHSPKICLPGNGWLVLSTKIDAISVPGRQQPIPVNAYVMEKSGDHILVLYWYQNNRNVWAEEFQAKLRLLPDLLRYRRADVSLVRLVTPLRGEQPQGELAAALEFTKLVFPKLAERFAVTN
ncbi:MAG TPA: EpsI family protein [Bryobacteraceae bacterium]|nr:EpsI family protein [Bryobacteraceae bacterium]HUO27894.1 EpsI family protein [Bryobacteraceae bacterium]